MHRSYYDCNALYYNHTVLLYYQFLQINQLSTHIGIFAIDAYVSVRCYNIYLMLSNNDVQIFYNDARFIRRFIYFILFYVYFKIILVLDGIIVS